MSEMSYKKSAEHGHLLLLNSMAE